SGNAAISQPVPSSPGSTDMRTNSRPDQWSPGHHRRSGPSAAGAGAPAAGPPAASRGAAALSTTAVLDMVLIPLSSSGRDADRAGERRVRRPERRATAYVDRPGLRQPPPGPATVGSRLMNQPRRPERRAVRHLLPVLSIMAAVPV